MRFILLSFSLLVSSVSFGQEARKILLIGIDGCRGDALQAANTPAIDDLISNATYSYDGRTQFPTYSGPGWSSMLTGVWGLKHGVTDNSFIGNDFENFPHFFSLIKSVEPDRYLASVCHWGPINNNITSGANYSVNVNTMQDAEEEGIAQLALDELDVLFIHLDDVDIAGHTSGFSVDSPFYIAAIESADGHVDALVQAVQQRSNFANEEWLIAISTDHGGLGYSHGGASLDERTIFTIFSGDNFPNEEIIAEYDEVESDASFAMNMNQTNVYGILDHPVYEFGENEDFTIELRFKTNGWTGDPSIISDKDWNSGFNPGFILALQTDEETWKFNLGDGGDRFDLNGGTVNDGQWHHLAVSVDRDGISRLWQDGEVLSTTTQTLGGSIISGMPIGVGQDGTMGYFYDFDGWIDELRIWNTVVDAEVLHDWACINLATDHPHYNDLIGYWRMEELGDFITFGSDPTNQVDMALVNGPFISSEGPMTCPTLISTLPEMVDIVPTMLTHMCINIDEAWAIDGQALGIEFADCPLSIGISNQPSLDLFPNPIRAGEFLSWSSPWRGVVEIFTLDGKLILTTEIRFGDSGIMLDVGPGVYHVNIEFTEAGKAFSQILLVGN